MSGRRRHCRHIGHRFGDGCLDHGFQIAVHNGLQFGPHGSDDLAFHGLDIDALSAVSRLHHGGGDFLHGGLDIAGGCNVGSRNAGCFGMMVGALFSRFGRRDLAKGGFVLPRFADQGVDIGNVQIVTRIVTCRCRWLFRQRRSGLDAGDGLCRRCRIARRFRDRLAGIFRRSAESCHRDVDDRDVAGIVVHGRHAAVSIDIITGGTTGGTCRIISRVIVDSVAKSCRQVDAGKRVVRRVEPGLVGGGRF